MWTKIKDFIKKFKKWIITALIGGIIIAATQIPGANNEVIYGPLPVYPWESKLGAEDVSSRTHFTKDYATSDPNKRVLIQSSGLLHYNDGTGFKDLQNLPFP